jgi:hypothetical protein
MPDLLSEEETRAAFAELRATELQRVRPPGITAAHQTVRRRTRAKAVVVAAGVVAMLGALGLAQNSLTDQSTGPTDIDPPTINLSPPNDLAEGWREVAEGAVMGLLPMNNISAISTGGLRSTVRDVDDTAAYPAYHVKVVCAGYGTIDVMVMAGSQANGAAVDCGASQSEAAKRMREIDIAMPSGVIGLTVTIKPNHVALNNSAYGYVITHP